MFDTRHRWMARLALLGCLCFVAIAGCSQKNSGLASAPQSNGSTGSTTSPAAAADEAVRRTLDGLQRKQVGALWTFLPPSYRRDVQTLVRDVANRLDEPSWQPFVKTIAKARQVLARKGDLLTQPDGAGTNDSIPPIPPETLRRLRRLFDAISESELSDLQRLRKIEVDQFLDKTGGDLLTVFGRVATGDEAHVSTEDSFARFGDVEVELVSSSAENAVVKVRWPKQSPTEHDFVRVEEHWIPRLLAEAWPDQLPAVREQCLAWADGLREHPELWHARLHEIDKLLDELDNAKTPAAARKVWQDGIAQRMWTWSQPSELPNTEPPVAPLTNANTQENSSPKPARVKRPDSEVLLPDEPEK